MSNPSAINTHPIQELREAIDQVNALTERLYDALEPVLLPVDSLPPCRKLVSVRRKNQVGGGNARPYWRLLNTPDSHRGPKVKLSSKGAFFDDDRCKPADF